MSRPSPAASTLTVTTLRVPGAAIGDVDPLPLLDRTLEPPFALGPGLPAEIRSGASFGWPRSMYPYLMQNRYSRDRRLADLTCVELRNEHLCARFLPELGGRLWCLVDRATGRDLVYRNRVVQPANLALRNAWFAGGVEWNIGTRGHSPFTSSPLHAARVTGPDGVATLRMWEYERLRGVVFQIDARLPPGSRALYIHVRIRNPNPEPVPMYWWSNAAVAEQPDVRVLAPATRAYATAYDGTVRVVQIPGTGASDRTRPTGGTDASDHFFDLAQARRAWIAAVDGTGHGLGLASTSRLIGRKLFCWGSGSGGQHWQHWLSPEGGRYLEIQAGLAATQFEHLAMPAGASWSWVEAYGDVAADPTICHGSDWAAATRHVETRVDALAPPAALDEQLRLATSMADTAPDEIICLGSGWGAVEREVRTRSGDEWLSETGTPFAAETVGPETATWMEILQTDANRRTALEDADPRVPPRSYVVGDTWRLLLAKRPGCWARDYHLAVLAHAAGDLPTAQALYGASLTWHPSAWALRGLAHVLHEQGMGRNAADTLRSAVNLAPDQPTLRHEAVAAALEAGDPKAALELVDTAPPLLRSSGRLRLLAVRAALACGDRTRAAQILSSGIDVPDLREGETSLSDLWHDIHPDQPVPERYDFRTYTDGQPGY